MAIYNHWAKVGAISLASLTLLLVGCEGTYRHATKSQADFERERAECQYEADKTTASMDAPEYSYERTSKVDSLIQQCLNLRGWDGPYFE